MKTFSLMRSIAILIGSLGCQSDPSSAPAPVPTPAKGTNASLAARSGARARTAALAVVLDNSSGDVSKRCDELEARLQREREKLSKREALHVLVLAFPAQGSNQAELSAWKTIPGFVLSGDVYDSLETELEATRAQQRAVIAKITAECRAKIKKSLLSPILSALRLAAKSIASECEIELNGGCQARTIWLHSDLVEEVQPALPKTELGTENAPVKVFACGYSAGRGQLTLAAQDALLQSWQKALGPALQLPLSPACAAQSEGDNG